MRRLKLVALCRLSHPSWVPDQCNKVLADPREVVHRAQAPAQTHRPLIGRRERVYLLPVTQCPVSASGWLTFGRYGSQTCPEGVCECENE